MPAAKRQTPQLVDINRCSATNLALILGMTSENVRLLKTKKIITEVARAKYDLTAAVPAYIAYTTVGGTDEKEVSVRKKLVEEQVRKLKIENDLAEGKTMNSDDALIVVAEGWSTLRNRMQGIPRRLQTELGAERMALVRKEIDDVLEVTADTLARLAVARESEPDVGEAEKPAKARPKNRPAARKSSPPRKTTKAGGTRSVGKPKRSGAQGKRGTGKVSK